MMGDHVAQKLTESNTKRTLGSIETQLMSPKHLKYTSEVTQMLGHHLALHNHIVIVNFDIFAMLRFKHSSHHLLVGRSSILQSKRHYLVMVILSGRHKSCFFLVSQG